MLIEDDNNPLDPCIYVKRVVFPHDFPISPKNFPENFQVYINSKLCRHLLVYKNKMGSVADDRDFRWL